MKKIKTNAKLYFAFFKFNYIINALLCILVNKYIFFEKYIILIIIFINLFNEILVNIDKLLILLYILIFIHIYI